MNVRPPIVVLDACVLFPAGLRNLMMWLAVNDLICPKWSEVIHEEWMRNVLAKRPDLTREQLERTRDLMNRHAEGCLVEGYERHLAKISLPDPGDVHVLAAAMECGAEGIVTWNVTDFPETETARFGITVLTPDRLLGQLIECKEDEVIAAMREHRLSLKHPAMEGTEYLEHLRRQGLTESIGRLAGRAGEL